MRNPPLCQVVDASGAARTTSFHLTRSSVVLRTALGRISSPRFLIRYTCRREQKQRAGNGSDVIFLLVALNCCHAGTIGAIPYVNQCCTLYPKPPKYNKHKHFTDNKTPVVLYFSSTTVRCLPSCQASWSTSKVL